MPANYDNSASFYDKLSRLVFGKALVNAQIWLLPRIPKNAKVLIVGGGTGWLLEEITKIYPGGLQITYIEISANMMALSRKRNIGRNKLSYLNMAVEQANLPQEFDVVITPFLFDNFTEANLSNIFGHIRQTLKPRGIWLNTDFQLTGKWWQAVILKSMLLFFKVVCRVESWRLPDVAKQFSTAGYRVEEQKTFFGDFVITKLYKKPF